MALNPRANVPLKDSWNLSAMYPSSASWEEHRLTLEGTLENLEQFRGRLSESSSTLLKAVETYLTTARGLEKLYSYASMKSDEDTADSPNLGRLEQASNLYARFSTAASFLTPELVAIPQNRFDELIAEPTLAPYRRMLGDIVRYRNHTLTQSEESLLAQGAEVFSACAKVFSQLNNADLRFPETTIDGVTTEITHGNYSLLLKNRDRTVREDVYKKYTGEFHRHKNTITATLSGNIKKEIYLSRARKHPSALAAALFPDNVPVSVYESLIAAVTEGLPALHRYYEIRKRALKLPEQRLFDTLLPLVGDVKLPHTYSEACNAVLDSLTPLGEEYCNTLRRGLCEERWVDVYENQGKRSGAYSGGCYDSYPYMLLNHQDDDVNSVFTLAHEAGHSMHSYFSIQNQPYQDHNYTIFVAEVASTFNEELLLDHLKHKYRDNPQVLLFLINHQIDEIKGTLFRQTMFAEFEKRVHEIVEANNPLTVEVLQEEYSLLLRKYFGPAVTFVPEDWIECLRIPHFYYGFYVYKYATGISAALALSQTVLHGGEAERNRYLSFLKSGASKHPIEQLRDAGVDMESSVPVVSAMKFFAKLVDELDRLIG